MLGAMRQAIGGDTPGAEPGAKRKRQDTDIEPFTYHSMVETIPSELLHAYHPTKVVIDGTPSVEWAMACIKTSTPYLGICYSEDHCKQMEAHLAHRIFCSMMDRNRGPDDLDRRVGASKA